MDVWVSRRGNGGGAALLAGLGGTATSDDPFSSSCAALGARSIFFWPGGGGGGGAGFLRGVGSALLKFFCLLSAAILSLSVLNWGSSASAMIAVNSQTVADYCSEYVLSRHKSLTGGIGGERNGNTVGICIEANEAFYNKADRFATNGLTWGFRRYEVGGAVVPGREQTNNHWTSKSWLNRIGLHADLRA